MTLLDTHARTGRMSRVNPVAKLGASALITIPLVLTLDVVSATVALVLELLLMPFAGLGWREFWARTWIVWALAPLTGLTIALYGRTSGEVYVDWLFVRVSEGSLVLALATTIRVLAIALPSVVLFAIGRPDRPRRRSRPGAEAPRAVRARCARRTAHGRAVPRRLACARARPPGAGRRRPRARPALPRHGVRAPGAVDPPRVEARDGDGGARIRRARCAHVGARVAVRRRGVDAHGRRASRSPWSRPPRPSPRAPGTSSSARRDSIPSDRHPERTDLGPPQFRRVAEFRTNQRRSS